MDHYCFNSLSCSVLLLCSRGMYVRHKISQSIVLVHNHLQRKYSNNTRSKEAIASRLSAPQLEVHSRFDRVVPHTGCSPKYQAHIWLKGSYRLTEAPSPLRYRTCPRYTA